VLLTEDHDMKEYCGSGGRTPRIPAGLDGGEWSASRPGRFTPRERAPGTAGGNAANCQERTAAVCDVGLQTVQEMQ
jgi:hypothetical protein